MPGNIPLLPPFPSVAKETRTVKSAGRDDDPLVTWSKAVAPTDWAGASPTRSMLTMPGGAAWEGSLSRAVGRVLGNQQLNHLVRFEPVLRLVRQSGPGRVLDVGSGSSGVAQLLGDGWRTTALDIAFDDEDGAARKPSSGERVVGDARRLPMPDAAFDVVVAVDLLEHLHQEDRPQAVRELCRVARAQVLIACPTGGQALEADRRLAERLESSGRRCPDWLEEHLDRGFPEPGLIVDAAHDFGQVQSWGHESIAAHQALIRAELSRLSAVPARLVALVTSLALRSHRRRPGQLAGRMLRRLRGSDRPPTYRTMVAIAVDEPALHDVDGQRGRQSSE